MKRKIGKTLTLLLAVCCMVMLLVPALAADSTEYTAEKTVDIDVTVSISGDTLRTGEDFTVTVTPVTEGAPMPEGTVDGVYTMTFEEVTSSLTLPFTLTFDNVGDYRYTIKQESGTNSYISYSEVSYELTVSVRYIELADGYAMTEDGKQAIQVGWVLSDGTEDKPDSLGFVNTYEEPEPSETNEPYYSPTPSPSTSVTPEPTTEITDEPVPTNAAETPEPSVEISEEPVPEGNLTIEDEPVPEGNVTIEDEGVPQGSLPQTGQLWWPVLLMGIAGLLLLAAAGFDIALTKRNESKD